MASVQVSAEKRIARPIEVVRAQFIDWVHHEQTQVHSALVLSHVRPTPGGVALTSRRRVLGLWQEDQMEFMREANGDSTARSVAGANVGLTVTQTFEEQGADATLVRLTVDMPLKGLMAWLKPLVRLGIARDLALGLEEDRVDLEERGYLAS